MSRIIPYGWGWGKFAAAAIACQDTQEAICYSLSVRGTDISHWQLEHI